MKTMHVRGAELAYQDHGQGLPLLFVHGHPFDHTMWDPQVDFLASDYRLVVPDLRGYGRSTVPDGTTLLDEVALDLAHCLDHLEIEKAVVCGLSMGGQVAMEFALLFPDRVLGLVLCDTDARAETAESRDARLAMAQRLETEGMAGYVEETLVDFLHPVTFEKRPAVVEHMRRMMLGAPHLGAARLQRGRAFRRDYIAALGSVGAPTLVVVGEADAFTPVPTAQQITDAIPAAELLVVPEAGHMPNLEAKTLFNQALTKLLDRVVGS
ncbi:MAG: alpha/beta fold hydrolase [Acidobacteriota bacterium]